MKLMGFLDSPKYSSVFLPSESRLDMPLVPRSGQTHVPPTDPIYSVPILLAGGLFFIIKKRFKKYLYKMFC